MTGTIGSIPSTPRGRQVPSRRGPLRILLALLLGLPSVATAQEVPCAAGPCTRPTRRGTHFIAELNGGGTLQEGGGLALEGLIGVGGKLRGFPARFYLVGELAYSSGTADGSISSSAIETRESRIHRDLALGIRIYLPIHGPLRLLADLMAGGSHTSAVFEREGLATLALRAWSPLGIAAAGLQFRLFHHLSLGLRARIAFTGDEMAAVREALGTQAAHRVSLTAGLTWHF